ncbi:DUF202 domain-containing protein [Corynebacterium hindlerae]|uniref:DUF202 domain-containing protein n=1 Tax=Corynebacterium hindlerae TaxID=699041 RepID=UPI003AAE1759
MNLSDESGGNERHFDTAYSLGNKCADAHAATCRKKMVAKKYPPRARRRRRPLPTRRQPATSQDARISWPASIPEQDFMHGDLGLQPERTVLSWTRTTMSFLVVAAAFLRWLPMQGALTVCVLTVAIIAAAFVVFTQRQRYARGSRGLIVERAGQAAHKESISLPRAENSPASYRDNSGLYTAGISSIVTLFSAFGVMVITMLILVWLS